MYPKPSQAVWEQALGLAADLGLSYERRDKKAQLFITNWARTASYEKKGLVADAAAEGWPAEGFQLHVFVSPFVEPARIYVDAIVRSRPALSGGVRRLRYYATEVSRWFLDTFQERLGEEGRAIPWDRSKRAALAQELGGPQPCETANGTIVAPRLLFKADIIYPAPDVDRRRHGTVIVEATLGEDGAIMQVRLVQKAQDSQMDVSAAMAVALWRYEPLRLGDCPAPAIVTVTASFRMQ